MDIHPRIKREDRTVAAMIALYCRRHHHSRHGLCTECQELRDYAHQRLEKCPYQDGKTVCSKCSVHCYAPEMRERIRNVMRYSGPRMLSRHPIMTLMHMIDKRRQEPVTIKTGTEESN